MITRLINILLIIVLGLTGYSPELLGLSIRFELMENLKIYIDPVLLYKVNFLPIGIAGYTNGDIILLKPSCDIFIPHEYNHISQYQALGDAFYLTNRILNLEGYPYYPDISCNDYMWKPPANWPFKWSLIEITIPLPDFNR